MYLQRFCFSNRYKENDSCQLSIGLKVYVHIVYLLINVATDKKNRLLINKSIYSRLQ